jgi:hypothetical protein
MASQPLRHLPNADRAIVEKKRIREYLLNLVHPDGGSKAKFFLARGFTPGQWELMAASLVTHGRINVVTRSVETEWGRRYTIECHCPTPDQRNPCIRTVWQMEPDGPRLLTAIPL